MNNNFDFQAYINNILNQSLGELNNNPIVKDRLSQYIFERINESMAGMKEPGMFNTQDYINKMFKTTGKTSDGVKTETVNEQAKKWPDPEIRETMDEMIYKILIPRGVILKNVSALIKGNDLYINWGETLGNQIIKLERSIIQTGTSGTVKDNFLIITLKKNDNPPFQKINLDI